MESSSSSSRARENVGYNTDNTFVGWEEEGQFHNAPVNNNGRGPTIIHNFEIDGDEMDSLMRETAEYQIGNGGGGVGGGSNGNLNFRKTARKGSQQQNGHSHHDNSNALTAFVGLVRSKVGNSATLRNVLLLMTLAICILLWLHLDWLIVQKTPEDVQARPPHASSFGGDRNPGHYTMTYGDDDLVATQWVNDDDYNGAKWGSSDDDATMDEDDVYSGSARLPKSNVGQAVKSKTTENTLNWEGHYHHDPFKSPYASPMYQSLSRQQLSTIQESFDAKRASIIERFGMWTAPSFGNLINPDFSLFDHKDMPEDMFPRNAWQADQNYTLQFLTQAKNLVQRVQNAILLEYGKDPQNSDDWKDFSVIFETTPNFATANGLAIDRATQEPLRGVAFLNGIAWEGLVRKLLHALITQDDFFVVGLGGGPYTYRANNFDRTQVMQFNEIMEPVFDKLGMTLISRNMGMDASSTVSALAGADIYGEADIFWYISDTRGADVAHPESDGQMDILQRQAILSGQRMPIILTPNPVGLAKDAQGKAWVGNIQNTANVCEQTTVVYSKVRLPQVKACEYVNCEQSAKDDHVCDVYESHCWVNRNDWNPRPDDTPQDSDAGYAHEGYPNYREHQWEGRKLALVVLQALQEALTRWNGEATAGRLPMSATWWHVGKVYEELRSSIRSLERIPGEAAIAPPCENMLNHVDPMICHMSMRGVTEWTPRVNPNVGISNIVTSFYVDNSLALLDLYHGVDLLPQEWRLSDDEIHVHMVAIATNDTVAKASSKNAVSLENQTFNSYDDDDLSSFLSEEEDFDDFMIQDDFLRTRNLATRGKRHLTPASQQRSPRRVARKVAPDQWTLYERPRGFCDGSAQSMCNRRIGNTCLLANNNFYKAGFVGHGNSDWLRMSIPITEGIVLLRFEWRMDLNSGLSIPDSESFLTNLPDDFSFEVDTDGSIKKYSRAEFLDLGKEIVDDLIVYPVFMNKAMSQTEGGQEELKLGIRFKTKAGADFKVLLTHVYYA